MITVRPTTPQDFLGCNGCSTEEATFAIEVGIAGYHYNPHVTRLCPACLEELGTKLDVTHAETEALRSTITA